MSGKQGSYEYSVDQDMLNLCITSNLTCSVLSNRIADGPALYSLSSESHKDGDCRDSWSGDYWFHALVNFFKGIVNADCPIWEVSDLSWKRHQASKVRSLDFELA